MPTDALLAQAISKDIQAVVTAEGEPDIKSALAVLGTGATNQFYMNDAALLQNILVGKGNRLDKFSVMINSQTVQEKSPTSATAVVQYTITGQIVDAAGKVVSKMATQKFKTYLWLMPTAKGWLIYNTAPLG